LKNSLSEMAKTGMLFKGGGEAEAEREFSHIITTLNENAEKIIRQAVREARENGGSINAYAVKKVIKEYL